MKNHVIENEKGFYERYKAYAQSYQPFEWDTAINGNRPEYIGLNDLLDSFYRHYKVMCEVKKRMSGEEVFILDFGVFPGVLPSSFRKLFPEYNIKYCGIGLGFTPNFVKEMKKLNISLFETELDPFYIKPKQVVPIDYRNADFVLFLDIIEHLASPIYALDAANRSLKKDGILILTTDNITSKDNFIGMLMGKTPLPHPLETHMFFIGDWRPHFREYSKDDLIWLLNHCGFKVEKHEYFYRRQGEYRLIHGKVVRRKQQVKKYFGRNIVNIIRWHLWRVTVQLLSLIIDLFPHFRNHQLVVARKTYEIDELHGKRPELQETIDGWLSIRK